MFSNLIRVHATCCLFPWQVEAGLNHIQKTVRHALVAMSHTAEAAATTTADTWACKHHRPNLRHRQGCFKELHRPKRFPPHVPHHVLPFFPCFCPSHPLAPPEYTHDLGPSSKHKHIPDKQCPSPQHASETVRPHVNNRQWASHLSICCWCCCCRVISAPCHSRCVLRLCWSGPPAPPQAALPLPTAAAACPLGTNQQLPRPPSAPSEQHQPACPSVAAQAVAQLV